MSVYFAIAVLVWLNMESPSSSELVWLIRGVIAVLVGGALDVLVTRIFSGVL